jgi:cytochrome c
MVRTLILSLLSASTLTCAAVAASGDAAKGAAVFNRCAVCHNADNGGGNRVGPNLFGVVGRKAASLPGFYYSPALKNSKIVWTDDMLRNWVQGPQRVVPGTRMTFPGLVRKEDVDDVIAYLHTKK